MFLKSCGEGKHVFMDAEKAEKLVKQTGIFIKPMPVLRHLSLDCWVYLCILWEDRGKARELLEKSEVMTQGVYLLSETEE